MFIFTGATEQEGQNEAEWIEYELRRINVRYEVRSQGLGRWAMADELAVGNTAWIDWYRMDSLYTDLEQSLAVRQVDAADFAKSDFVDVCTRWEVSCQKKMTTANADALFTTHEKLASVIPDRFKSARGDVRKAISDMVNAHLGEMREVDGKWVELEHASLPASAVGGGAPSPQEERLIHMTFGSKNLF